MRAQHSARGRQARRWVYRGLLAALIALVGLGAAAVMSGRYQVRPVLSGSMRPGLPVGGLVITHRVAISSLHVRDVVVIHRPDRPQELVVHRIISLTRGQSGLVVQTQGDANNTPDPWKVTLRGTTAYRAVYSLPLMGYAAVWVHSPFGRKSFLLVGLLLFVGAATGSLVARLRHATRSVEGSDQPPEGGAEQATDVDADPRLDASPALSASP